jgi:hypothetical protein
MHTFFMVLIDISVLKKKQDTYFLNESLQLLNFDSQFKCYH